MADKLNKTEQRILDALRSRPSNRFTPEGARENAAATKLIARGLVRVVTVHRGCVYTRHGNGRTAFSKPHYYADRVLAEVGRE